MIYVIYRYRCCFVVYMLVLMFICFMYTCFTVLCCCNYFQAIPVETHVIDDGSLPRKNPAKVYVFSDLVLFVCIWFFFGFEVVVNSLFLFRHGIMYTTSKIFLLLRLFQPHLIM